jgi:hypothetical protein
MNPSTAQVPPPRRPVLRWLVIGLLLATLLLMLLVAGSVAWLGHWLVGQGDVTLHIDGETLHLGQVTQSQATLWAVLATVGVVVAVVVCLIVVPLSLVFGLLVPLVVVATVVLGVLLPVGAVLVLPLLLVWAVAAWRRRSRAAQGPVPVAAQLAEGTAGAPAQAQARP